MSDFRISSSVTMELQNGNTIKANGKNIYLVSFSNDIEKNNLSKLDVDYVFSKFGSVLEIHYVEHGRVFVAYKDKQDAKKAMDIMKLAQKYFLRPKYIKPKDKSETTQRTTKMNKVSVSNFYQNKKSNLTMSGPFEFDLGAIIVPDPFQQERLKNIKKIKNNYYTFSTRIGLPIISETYRQPFTAGLKFRGRGIQTRSFDEILSHRERHSTILQKFKESPKGCETRNYNNDSDLLYFRNTFKPNLQILHRRRDVSEEENSVLFSEPLTQMETEMVVPIRKRHVVRGFKRNPKNGITECGCINECHIQLFLKR